MKSLLKQITSAKMFRTVFPAASLAALLASGSTQAQPPHFHLAPQRTEAPPISRQAMLDRLEGLCRFTVQFQDSSGAVIDPFQHREFQYATPYFAFAVATLVDAGRSPDLLPHGVAAMERSTSQLAGGHGAIPDGHGEFFLASVTEAMPIYRKLVPAATWQRWSGRLRLPIEQIIMAPQINNWRTYAMKGQWQRAQQGFVSHTAAVRFIEENWLGGQRDRFAEGPVPIYHDHSSDPDTLSVALVGEANLLALVLEGYDGPSATDIKSKVLAALRATVFLVDPTGQVPPNGRTDDHVWPEVGLQLLFSAAGPLIRSQGDVRTADDMERIARLSFAGMDRWRREDGIWKGSYFITKNHFDPALRVGYQNASQYSNYTGSLMFHLAELYRIRRSQRPRPLETPSDLDVGGYAVELDPSFATAFANAGGLQLQFNLRGETKEVNDNWWTPLGVVRIGRPGWDTRLGPADGAQTATDAVSLAPEILVDGIWTRLAALPGRYQASWSVQTLNPAIIRCTMEYRPIAEGAGPVFRDHFILTPDGALESMEQIAPHPTGWGVTWPLMVNDGRPLQTNLQNRIAETSYTQGSDTQSFLALDPDSRLNTDQAPVRSTFGDLLPVRLTGTGDSLNTFLYPHTAAQPDAQAVLDSFRLTPAGFRSLLGRVDGDTYISATFAGGIASTIDLDGDGAPDIRLSRQCGFVLQLSRGKVTAIETDARVTVTIRGRVYRLGAYRPLHL